MAAGTCPPCAECGLHLIIIALPSRQYSSRLRQGREQRLVQTLVAPPSDEALRERILLRLAGRNVMPADLALLTPAQHRRAGQLGAVIADAQHRLAATGDDRVQFAGDADT